MSDTNIYGVEQVRTNLDIIDEAWEKDYLSDDDLIIAKEIDAFMDHDNENGDEEQEEIKEDSWTDAGADRLMLEALSGDNASHRDNNQHSNNSNNNGSNGHISSASSISVLFLPQVPNH